ncbi:hypothetical protein IC229_04290 [Spirosoma sp. BT702]|uniref:Uncharacterized protein n=1 Tax=Spirosoma profusum TaxID=2771354 RepID=A0A926XXM5_9BACT|nr:hypothetical protein [Spirosoma profusum]MBD2699842.1 hypothetical protein [Spirosoma profusum]
MFDGTTILDVSVDVDLLLTNDRLTFGALVDTQTGFILNPIRRANHRGLRFRLVPRQTQQGYRLEMKGSLHKFHNNGRHNADQFTVNDLLLTLDEITRSYGFNLFKSKINTLEFGVNVELPFPVSQVLNNLVCYKNLPFSIDPYSDTPYYICRLQRYAVKCYDKGKQKGLDGNWLRLEIRVNKMEYFKGNGIKIRTLADLMNVANYPLLGALLVDTFNEILFDDPAIISANLSPVKQQLYQNGRNSRYWQIPEDLTRKQANAHYQRLGRERRRYRVLFEQYGGKWQHEAATLIGQTWTQLTAIDDPLLKHINEHLTAWQDLTKPGIPPPSLGGTCQQLTDPGNLSSEDLPYTTCQQLTNFAKNEMSAINPLYSELIADSNQPDKYTLEPPDPPPPPGAVVCPITNIPIESPRPSQRFLSATQLRNLYDIDRPKFDNVAARFLTAKQAGVSLDKQCYYMAHNIRNSHTNQFNNPLRRIKKYQRGPSGQLPLLFPNIQLYQFSERIQAGIAYRRGTRHEIDI